MKRPDIDMGECVDCESCVELCPSVFRRNDAGYIEVLDLAEYPEEEVEEVIKNCPSDCVKWEQLGEDQWG